MVTLTGFSLGFLVPFNVVTLPRYEYGDVIVLLAEIPGYFIRQSLHALCPFHPQSTIQGEAA